MRASTIIACSNVKKAQEIKNEGTVTSVSKGCDSVLLMLRHFKTNILAASPLRGRSLVYVSSTCTSSRILGSNNSNGFP